MPRHCTPFRTHAPTHPHTYILRALLLLLAAGTLRAEGPASSNVASPQAVLQRLEKAFSGVRTVQASFRQERRLAMFNKEVVIEGSLSLEIPGRMAWHVDKPLRYSFVLSDTHIRQWDEATGRAIEMPINSNPVLKVVAQQMPRWFAGQFQSLTGLYEVAVLGEHPCRLAFAPRGGGAEGVGIQRMTVTFREDERYVQQVRIEEPGGDVTTLVFTGVRLNEPIDSRAWEVKPRG